MTDTPVTASVSYHAWNKDQSMIALSPNTNEVWIYASNKSSDTTKWTRKFVLDEHGGQVSNMSSKLELCAGTNCELKP